MPPFFSIIIPTLNEEEYLPKLLTDISNQSFQDVEIFVVDGRSEDKTRQRARQYTKVAIIDCHERHVSVQRNMGAWQSKGDFLLFFDADTRIGSDFLQALKNQLKKHPSDVSVCWTKELGKQTTNSLIHTVVNIGVELSKAMDKPTAQGSQMCFNREVFNKIKGFSETINYAEDTEIVRRAVNMGYHFEVYKTPQFEYSLRRIKTNGLGKSLENYIKLGSQVMKNEYPTKKVTEYPMDGGKMYPKRKKQKTIKLRDVLQKIVS